MLSRAFSPYRLRWFAGRSTFLGKPVLVMRNETERPEAVKAGTVKIIGTDRRTIVEQTSKLLSIPSEYTKMAQSVNPYGDGYASSRIVDAIRYWFKLTR